MMFNGRVSASSIGSYWDDQAWEKYKLCRENLVKQNGGGDGDLDWFEDRVVTGNFDNTGHTDDDADTDDSTPKPCEQRFILQGRVTGKFKRPTLLKFLKSAAYAAIHKR